MSDKPDMQQRYNYLTDTWEWIEVKDRQPAPSPTDSARIASFESEIAALKAEFKAAFEAERRTRQEAFENLMADIDRDSNGLLLRIIKLEHRE